MADLSVIEKRKLEKILEMGGGYVLAFSNRTFHEFFKENFHIDIYDQRYDGNGSSKANHLRAFWSLEGNNLVGRVLDLLFREWNEFRSETAERTVPEEIWKIVERLKSSPAIDTIIVNADPDDVTFEILANSVRESIAKNEPAVALDRLHTYVTKYFRKLCEKRKIEVGEKPLHSLVGEYVKDLRTKSQVESEMTERILKSSIAIFDSFNFVRNNRSLAHDNTILNHDESLLVFLYVSATINFVENIERKVARDEKLDENDYFDDIPF